MSDHLTLIEKIQQNQAEINKDLELLKNKESEQFSEAIESIQNHQSAVAAEVFELDQKIRETKGGSK